MYFVATITLQIDLCFAVAMNDSNDNEDDGDDSDDEKDEPTKDIKGKLTSRERVFFSTEIDDEMLLKNTDDNSLQFSRFLGEKMYKEFRTQLSEKASKYDSKTYPRHRRFGIFVDRDNDSTKDEITFFEVCCVKWIVYS